MIRIEYTFSAQDFRALTFYMFRPNWRIRLVLMTIVMLYLYVGAMLSWLDAGNGVWEAAGGFGKSLLSGREHYSTYLFMLGAFLLVCFIEYVAMAIRVPLYSRSTRNLIGTLTIVLAEESVQISDRTAESNIKWSGITRVTITQDHIFLVIRYPFAKMIPRRAFATPTGFDEALVFIKSHVDKDTPIEAR